MHEECAEDLSARTEADLVGDKANLYYYSCCVEVVEAALPVLVEAELPTGVLVLLAAWPMVPVLPLMVT